MIRDEDETGNSGTGVVGEVTCFSDGTAVLKWSCDSNALQVSSVVIYQSLADLVKVHGHGGKTRLEAVQILRCHACGYTWSEGWMWPYPEDVRGPAHMPYFDGICVQCDIEGVNRGQWLRTGLKPPIHTSEAVQESWRRAFPDEFAAEEALMAEHRAR